MGILIVLALPAAAWADVHVWTPSDPTDIDWSNPDNWVTHPNSTCEEALFHQGHAELTTGSHTYDQVTHYGLTPGGIAHTGGSLQAGALFLGIDGTSTYDLTGSGTVTLDQLSLGIWGTGSLTQSGGSMSANYVYVGGHIGSSGDLVINGGLSSVGMVHVKSGSSVTVNSTMEIGTLTLDAGATLQGGSGSILQIGGNSHLDIRTNDPSQVRLQDATIQVAAAEAGQAGPKLEAAAVDRGATDAGFVDNVVLGTLRIDTASDLPLLVVDETDNTPGAAGSDAVYVETLEIGDVAWLDAGTVPIYYRNGGEVKRLLSGDNNLDGEVNLLDFSMMCSNY
ncbi:MAG: hypothetical protein ACLFVU_13425, partial [Phycisphaerae bacterium]